MHHEHNNTYKLVTHNPTNAIAYDSCTLIHYTHSQHIKARPPWNFYWLLRIHAHLSSMDYQKCKSQTTPKLHPIVLRCGSPTDHLSSYITPFIQPLANNLPSHIKDTKHFFNLIEKLPPLPTNARKDVKWMLF